MRSDSALFLAIVLALPALVGAGEPAEPPVAPEDAATESAPATEAGDESGAEGAGTEATGLLEREQLSGDWFGLRPKLVDRGITWELWYTADVFTNLHGGLNTDNTDTYLGLLDLSLSLDTEAMGLWKGGTIYLDFQNFEGRSITDRHIGDLMLVNNDDAPRRSQLSEFWLEQRLLDDRIRLKLGKQEAFGDFFAPKYGEEFVNAMPGWLPNLPLPTYPDQAMGAVAFVDFTDWFTLAAGMYDAEGLGNSGGFHTAFHSPDDAVYVMEAVVKPNWSVRGAELPGSYRFGAWYHSGEWDEFRSDLDGRLPALLHRGDHGLYFALDQLLYKEPSEDEESEQGLGMFLAFGWAPDEYNEISQVYGVGWVYTGLLPKRDNDLLGLGLYHANLSGRLNWLEDRHSESVVELFYKYQITPAISLKPDLQYIVNPGGDGRDALALGARFEVSF